MENGEIIKVWRDKFIIGSTCSFCLKKLYKAKISLSKREEIWMGDVEI